MSQQETLIKKRFRFDGDAEKRIYIFPLVATWRPGQSSERVSWTGASQVQDSFARRLFERWMPLTTKPGTSNSPTILWHTTEGEGFCLVRLAFNKETWNAVAALVSRGGGAAMQADPFVLMYGHTAPSPKEGGFKAEKVRIGKLYEDANERFTKSLREEDLTGATATVDKWWDKAIKATAPPVLSAPDNQHLMLSALLAWGRIPVTDRAGLNLLLAPQSPVPAGLMSPLMICARKPRTSERTKPAKAKPEPRKPTPEPVPLRPEAEARPITNTGIEARLKSIQKKLSEAQPALKTPEPVEVAAPMPTAATSDVPAPTVELPIRGGSTGSEVVTHASPIEVKTGRRGPVTSELAAPKGPEDLTDTLLANLQMGRIPVGEDFESALRQCSHFAEPNDYVHLLDRLVCGLETCIEQVPEGTLLDIFSAYSPINLSLPKTFAAPFGEALADIVCLARVGTQQLVTERWVLSLARHPRRDELMAQGLDVALSPRLMQFFGAEAVGGALRECLDKGGVMASGANEADVEVFIDALSTRPPVPEPVVLPRKMPPSIDVAVVELNQPEDLERRRSKVNRHLDAIASVGRFTFASAATSEPAISPELDLEERLLTAWGIHNPSKPCLLWEPVCNGDAWRTLVEMVSVNMQEAEKSPASFPISMRPMGPATSCEVLLESVERMRTTGHTPDLADSAGACFDPDYELAGPAFDCTPLRNLWGRVGRRENGVGGVGGAGAVLVSPSGGAGKWPSLVERASGIIFIADIKTIAHAPRRARQSVIDALAGLTSRRPDKAPPLRCAFILGGLESLNDTTHAPLAGALGEALSRLADNRTAGLSETLLRDMTQLGKLALQAVEADWLNLMLREFNLEAAFFVTPRAGMGRASTARVHDLPLLWLMRACRVKLNLSRKGGSRRSSAPHQGLSDGFAHG